MPEHRKLAAILAADVVGYSRLTGADGDRTLARLRALRSDLIDPTIAVDLGRVVKRTGDGALSISCGRRRALRHRGTEWLVELCRAPAERHIEFVSAFIWAMSLESDGDLMGDSQHRRASRRSPIRAVSASRTPPMSRCETRSPRISSIAVSSP
jgi:adenylate cyclase